MQVILYDPKDPVFPPPHELVDTQPRRGRRSVAERSLVESSAAVSFHRRCLAGEFRGQKGTRYETDPDVCTADPKCRLHRIWPCAACDWRAPEVVKVRREKKARLDHFLRTGKVTGWAGESYPKGEVYTKHPRMSDAEAARVVLPHLQGWAAQGRMPRPEELMRPQDYLLHDVANKYLQAVGERRLEGEEKNSSYGCGCYVEESAVKPCKRHRRALLDGAEED